MAVFYPSSSRGRTMRLHLATVINHHLFFHTHTRCHRLCAIDPSANTREWMRAARPPVGYMQPTSRLRGWRENITLSQIDLSHKAQCRVRKGRGGQAVQRSPISKFQTTASWSGKMKAECHIHNRHPMVVGRLPLTPTAQQHLLHVLRQPCKQIPMLAVPSLKI